MSLLLLLFCLQELLCVVKAITDLSRLLPINIKMMTRLVEIVRKLYSLVREKEKRDKKMMMMMMKKKKMTNSCL
jgi:uncharacterized membrane protein